MESYYVLKVHVLYILELQKKSHFRHMSERTCKFSMEMDEYTCTSFMETYVVANDVEI